MADELTKAELYTEAQALEIEGRSTMGKDELAQAVEAARDADAAVDEAAAGFAAGRDKLDESNEPPAESPATPKARTTQGGTTVLTDSGE